MATFCGMCSDGIGADGVVAFTNSVVSDIAMVPAIGGAQHGGPLPSISDVTRSSVPNNGPSPALGK